MPGNWSAGMGWLGWLEEGSTMGQRASLAASLASPLSSTGPSDSVLEAWFLGCLEVRKDYY